MAQTMTIRIGGEVWLTRGVSARRARRLRSLGVYPLARGRRGDLDAELGELCVVHRAGRPGEEIRPARGLGKRDDVADRVAPRDQHRDPVQAERETAVRGSAEPQRFQQEPEARLGLLLGDPERLEDLLLDVRAVDTDRPTADLRAVEDHVVAA